MLPPLLFLPAALLLLTLNDVPQAHCPISRRKLENMPACNREKQRRIGSGRKTPRTLGTVDSQINGRRAWHGDAAPRRDGQTDEIAAIPAAEIRLNGNEKEMGLVARQREGCMLAPRPLIHVDYDEKRSLGVRDGSPAAALHRHSL